MTNDRIPRAEKDSKKVQYLSLLAVCCIGFGDGIEDSLPSIITQPTSCQLKISPEAENLLGTSLYIAAGVWSVVTIPISNRLGRRLTLLLAMYFAILVTVLSAIVPNYTTLLLSRLGLGAMLATNTTTCFVYIAEMSSTPQFYTQAIVLINIAFSSGSTWSGLLAYYTLEQIGWRYFVIITSAPIFITPLILLQFVLPDPKSESKQDDDYARLLEDNNGITEPLVSSKDEPQTLMGVIVKLLLIVFFLVTCMIMHGSRLLLPAFMRKDNLQQEYVENCGAVHGFQFLILSIVFGICKLGGCGLCYILQSTLSSAGVLSITSTVTAILLIILNVHNDNMLIIYICFGAFQVNWEMVLNQIALITNDVKVFSTRYVVLASGVTVSTLSFLVAIGNGISSVFDPVTALKIHLGFALFGLPACWLLFKKNIKKYY